MKIGEAMYKAEQASQGQAGAGPQNAGAAKDEKVVDAEFEEVNDHKKKSG